MAPEHRLQPYLLEVAAWLQKRKKNTEEGNKTHAAVCMMTSPDVILHHLEHDKQAIYRRCGVCHQIIDYDGRIAQRCDWCREWLHPMCAEACPQRLTTCCPDCSWIHCLFGPEPDNHVTVCLVASSTDGGYVKRKTVSFGSTDIWEFIVRNKMIKYPDQPYDKIIPKPPDTKRAIKRDERSARYKAMKLQREIYPELSNNTTPAHNIETELS